MNEDFVQICQLNKNLGEELGNMLMLRSIQMSQKNPFWAQSDGKLGRRILRAGPVLEQFGMLQQDLKYSVRTLKLLSKLPVVCLFNAEYHTRAQARNHWEVTGHWPVHRLHNLKSTIWKKKCVWMSHLSGIRGGRPLLRVSVQKGVGTHIVANTKGKVVDNIFNRVVLVLSSMEN